MNNKYINQVITNVAEEVEGVCVEYVKTLSEDEMISEIKVLSDKSISIIEKAISKAEYEGPLIVHILLQNIQNFENVIVDKSLFIDGNTTLDNCEEVAMRYFRLMSIIDAYNIHIPDRIIRDIKNNVSAFISYIMRFKAKSGYEFITNFLVVGFNPFSNDVGPIDSDIAKRIGEHYVEAFCSKAVWTIIIYHTPNFETI